LALALDYILPLSSRRQFPSFKKPINYTLKGVKSAAGEKQPLVARIQLSQQLAGKDALFYNRDDEGGEGGCNAKPASMHPLRLIFSISAPVTLEKKTEPP
jgi:hypothetical protein